jgi:O-antigen/teichoic acid export membrane protein
MGVIQSQGVKDSVVTYTGVVIGAVNTLIIYPYFLKEEELGLFQFMVSSGMILSLFVGMGAYDLVTRFFPVFRNDERKHQGFLFIMLMVPVAGIILLSLLTLLLKSPIEHFMQERDVLMQAFWPWLLPLSFFLGVNVVLINYTKNFLRIAIPTFIENVFVKICTALMAVLLFYAVISIHSYVVAIIVTYLLVSIGLVIYLIWLKQFHIKPDFSILNKGLLRQMSLFAFYSMLGGFSSGFLTWIDRIMISLLMDETALKSVGIFSIVAYIGMVIDVPRRSLEKIAAPVVADAFVQQDLEKIHRLYKKSSLTQLLAGLLLFLLICCNIDAMLMLMPNGDRYISGKSIVFILGFSSLISMVAGINHQILTYSRYYRLNFFILLALAIINVIMNYVMIKTLGYGITGAALATLISMIIFHLSKIWLIWHKFRMLPFSKETLYVTALGLAIFLIFIWIPPFLHPFFEIPLKSAVISFLFVAPVLYFRWSEEATTLWHKLVGWWS